MLHIHNYLVGINRAIRHQEYTSPAVVWVENIRAIYDRPLSKVSYALRLNDLRKAVFANLAPNLLFRSANQPSPSLFGFEIGNHRYSSLIKVRNMLAGLYL